MKRTQTYRAMRKTRKRKATVGRSPREKVERERSAEGRGGAAVRVMTKICRPMINWAKETVIRDGDEGDRPFSKARNLAQSQKKRNTEKASAEPEEEEHRKGK